MCQACNHLSNRSQSLALNKFLLCRSQIGLGLTAFRHVPHDSCKNGSIAYLHLADGKINRNERAIFSLPEYLPANPDDRGLASLHVLSKIAVVCGPIRLRHQHRNIVSHNFHWRKAKEVFKSSIDEQHRPPFIDRNDCVDSSVQDRC